MNVHDFNCSAICEYLMTAEILASVGKLIGVRDLIQSQVFMSANY